MSHHFEPEFTVLPTGKEPASKKLQRNTEKSNSAKRREIEQLDFDNKQLEWKLSQLRQVMSKEKEDRGKQGSIWKSGNARIESHSRNILGRTVSGSSTKSNRYRTSPKSGSNSSPKSPTKVKILKDEPLDVPQRDSLTKDLMRRFNSDAPPAEDPRKKVQPTRQLEYWIKFSADKDSPDVFDLQSNLQGNLELSTVKAINSTAVGIYFMKWGRKRLLIASEGVIRKPKQGWGDEIYYPYTVKSQTDVPMRPAPPANRFSKKPVIISPQPPKNGVKGGDLLQGSFDEKENAAAFQMALLEWRNGKSSEENSPTKTTEYSVQSRDKAPPEMSVHVAQCTPEPFEVKFSETSTLSYMEKVLLQKHRQSDVPPLPRSLTDTVNQYLDPDSIREYSSEEKALTEEEEKERERYRQLFSPQKNEESSVSIAGVQFKEVEFDDGVDVTEDCIVEESPPPSPTPSAARSGDTVKIEEVSYGVDTSTQLIEETSSQKFVIQSQLNGFDGKENYDPKASSRAHKSPKFAGTKIENVLKSTTDNGNKPVRDRNPSIENGHGKKGISCEASVILQEIGKLPINPDTLYNKGLDVFFIENSQNEKKPFESQFHNFEGHQTSLNAQKSWNPLVSVPEENDNLIVSNLMHEADNPIVSNFTPESNGSTFLIDGKQTPIVDSDGLDGQHLSAKYSNHYDINSESDDSADERALDDLEWELASQMGNITADGRISRLIDEWPEEGDLDIIEDPGSGSGLTTPDNGSSRPSRLNTPDESDSRMQYDFHNMEHIMMDDLNDEYLGDEV